MKCMIGKKNIVFAALILATVIFFPAQAKTKPETEGLLVSKGGTKIVRSAENTPPVETKKVEAPKKTETKKVVQAKKSNAKVKSDDTSNSKSEVNQDDQDKTPSVDDAATTEDQSNAITVSQDNKNAVEDEMIKSMMKDFPAKSEFISSEDQKSGAVLNSSQPTVATKSTLPVVPEPENMTTMFIKMMVTTLVMALGIFILAYVWKFIQNRNIKLFPDARNGIKILSQQFIGNKSKILIIETLGKRYLVGATEASIQLLADIDFFEENALVTKIPTEKQQLIPLTENKTSLPDFSAQTMPALQRISTETKPAAEKKKEESFEQVLTVDLSTMKTSQSTTPLNSASFQSSAASIKKMKASTQIRERLKELKRLG